MLSHPASLLLPINGLGIVSRKVAFAKLGGIPPLITWLSKDAIANQGMYDRMLVRRVQSQAAKAMLCLAADNATTQGLVAKSDGIPPLISLVKKSSPEAQEHAASALWHLASQIDNRITIVEAGGIKVRVTHAARLQPRVERHPKSGHV